MQYSSPTPTHPDLDSNACVCLARRATRKSPGSEQGTTMDDGYHVTARNRVKRRHERGRYDRETVHAVLDEGLVCHLGFVVDGQPFVIPTGYWRQGERVYIHGSAASRTLRALKDGIAVCMTEIGRAHA